MRKVRYTWAWAEGSRLPRGHNASELGPEIMRLVKLYRQKLTAEQLLAEATGASSPLHPAFEWDDAKAAYQFRLTEARHLLRSIQYAIETSDGEVKGRSTTLVERVFHSGKYYYAAVKPREVVKEYKMDCDRMAGLAIRHLEILRKKCPRFGRLPILEEAIRQMEETRAKGKRKDKIKRKGKRKKTR